ncbi:MAG: DNA photolyase [Candidatus Dadabacteria bacterium]|nr:MAG: DNA photolyase [Candidatus Dadabacteria bacterium]
MQNASDNYLNKLEKIKESALYQQLGSADTSFIDSISRSYRFTYQELRILLEAARDLEMWGLESFKALWEQCEREVISNENGSRKKEVLRLFRKRVSILRDADNFYPKEGFRPPARRALKIISEKSNRKIFGDCPVASEKTVCCNLKTIDAVQNCAFGCSYCTIQTFYGDSAVVEEDLKSKLDAIELESGRFYHIGTGQSSDSLVWGNRNGMLDDLADFATSHPNILLELKTKSANVSWFLKNKAPANMICSWSLNTPEIIRNEEHFTASLEKRLEAAEAVVKNGGKIAFHFHPIVHYKNWKDDYLRLAESVQSRFSSDDILFISFGSLTFIKPVIKEIRKRGGNTNILKMPMVPDPHGKLTYPDDIKVELFKTMYGAFSAWHEKVYFYLCMERAEIWDRVFGWHYQTNSLFEKDFGRRVMEKLRQPVQA